MLAFFSTLIRGFGAHDKHWISRFRMTIATPARIRPSDIFPGIDWTSTGRAMAYYSPSSNWDKNWFNHIIDHHSARARNQAPTVPVPREKRQRIRIELNLYLECA
jgi:hypothetical protein